MEKDLNASFRRERLLKLGAVTACLLAGLVVVVEVDHLLLSLVLATVSTYLLQPIVDWFEARGVPRQAAILIPFIAAGLLIAFGIYEVLPLITQQATLLESKLPKYQVDLTNMINQAEAHIHGIFRTYDFHILNSAKAWIAERTTGLSSSLAGAVSGSLTVLLLAPFFSFFMLLDGRRASRNILTMVPNNLFETALNIHHELNQQVGGFIRARFLEAAIVGIVVWLGLQISGFPYAGLLGLFAGLMNLIPYIGPIFGAVPALLIALISDDAMITHSIGLNLLIVTSIYFFAQLIDIVFVIPMVVAKIVNLHPVTVVIVIIIGSQLMGILGMVISIPVASALKLIAQSLYDHFVDSHA